MLKVMDFVAIFNQDVMQKINLNHGIQCLYVSIRDLQVLKNNSTITVEIIYLQG